MTSVTEANIDFIIQAQEDIAMLIAEVERLQAQQTGFRSTLRWPYDKLRAPKWLHKELDETLRQQRRPLSEQVSQNDESIAMLVERLKDDAQRLDTIERRLNGLNDLANNIVTWVAGERRR